jgi:hypothetical protein
VKQFFDEMIDSMQPWKVMLGSMVERWSLVMRLIFRVLAADLGAWDGLHSVKRLPRLHRRLHDLSRDSAPSSKWWRPLTRHHHQLCYCCGDDDDADDAYWNYASDDDGSLVVAVDHVVNVKQVKNDPSQEIVPVFHHASAWMMSALLKI